MWKDEWFGEYSSSYVTKRGVPQETRLWVGGPCVIFSLA